MTAVPEDPLPAADLSLARAVVAREEAAIGEFSDRLRCVPRILAAQNARLGRPLDDHDLADLAQDTVVVILEKLDEFAGRAPLEGWIYQVCRFELMNWVRRKRRSPRQLESFELATDEAEQSDLLARRELLVAALARVGGLEAETIAIKHFEGVTFEEMALRMGVPSSTLKTRYYKGMIRLEEVLRSQLSREKGAVS